MSDSPSRPDPEVFFGQPRRLRLIDRDGDVVGVVQQPWGTNYTGWSHPLTPYYKNGTETLPRHPKPGGFCYRNWKGVILTSEAGQRPLTLLQYLRDIERIESARCSLIVAGWAMDNMKPLDFLWSEQPLFPLSSSDEDLAVAAVEAAEQVGCAVAACVRESVGEEKINSGAGQRAREAFFAGTQRAFEEMVEAMSAGSPFSPERWVALMRRAALRIFDGEVMPGLADLEETRRRNAIKARTKLIAAFVGQPPFGKKIFDPLGLPSVEQTKQRGRG